MKARLRGRRRVGPARSQTLRTQQGWFSSCWMTDSTSPSQTLDKQPIDILRVAKKKADG
jgi:hypothetical protein